MSREALLSAVVVTLMLEAGVIAGAGVAIGIMAATVSVGLVTVATESTPWSKFCTVALLTLLAPCMWAGLALALKWADPWIGRSLR